MRSIISVRSIPGATTKSMFHHIKGCLENTSPDFIILHHGTNNLNGNSTFEEIADKILNSAASIKTGKNQVFVSGLVIRKDKFNDNASLTFTFNIVFFVTVGNIIHSNFL